MNRPAWRIMSEELKPCPFCGGEVTRTVEKSYRYVSCENYDCFAVVEAGALSGSEEEAIKMWNTRKGEDERIAQAVAAERARIVGELREKLIRSRELLEMGHEFASEYVTAFSTAIAIAEGES